DVLHAQAFERVADLIARLLVRALGGLCREEELVTVLRHPGADSPFGAAVHRRRVDVVDAVVEEEPEHGLRLFVIRDVPECGGAEDRARAHVAGPTERLRLDHGVLRRACPGWSYAVCQSGDDAFM